MLGRFEVGEIVYPFCPPFTKSAVPVILKLMVSAPLPAAHSPAATPEAVSSLAAMMFLLSVQAPLLVVVSALELTTMLVAAWVGACQCKKSCKGGS